MSSPLLPWMSEHSVSLQIEASRPWWKDADIPDPLDSMDVAQRPDLVAAAIQRRSETGGEWGTPRALAYPKPAGGFRVMVHLDRPADLAYRQKVGRVVARIEASLPPTVYNARTRGSGSVWQTQPWRGALRRYQAALEVAREPDIVGEMHIDVRSHFATVGGGTLSRCLHSAGADAGPTRALLGSLETLHEIPGLPTGLPIGPEASAPLGTLALLPVDRCLFAAGFLPNRWMDDVSTPLRDESLQREVIDLVASQVAYAGQELNLEKCRFVPLGDDHQPVSIVGGGRMLSDDPVVALELAGALGDPRGVTMALGLLRSRRDPSAVPIVKTYSWLVSRFPRQVGLYLDQVMTDADPWDWAVDLVLAPTVEANAASQLHLARILPRSTVSASVASELFDKALGLRRATYAPLADHLFVTAGRSDRHNASHRRRSLELAVELGELDAQRSLISTLRFGGVGREARAGLRHLVRRQPDLAATSEWVLAA